MNWTSADVLVSSLKCGALVPLSFKQFLQTRVLFHSAVQCRVSNVSSFHLSPLPLHPLAVHILTPLLLQMTSAR